MNSRKEKKLYTLDDTLLRRGDIILTTSKDRISTVIRFLTFGPFSHAMIYLGGQSCSDAGGPGIRVASNNTQRIFFESHKHCCVLRLKEDISESDMDNIIDNARCLIGMEYSLDEAKLVALRVKFSSKEINRQFCSRYVAQAYSKEGINIVRNPDYCSPVDIFNSDLLIKIEPCLREASEEEIEVLGQESIPLSAKYYADEYMFSKARELSSYDIQTLEQFNSVLLKHSNFDVDFSQIMQDSGFLDLWELETKDNPWFYDFQLMKQKYPDDDFLRDIGAKQLPDETELRRGWNLTIQTLRNSNVRKYLNTFELQIKLHEKLIELSNIREDTWRKCIAI